MDKQLLTHKEAAQMLSISLRHFHNLRAEDSRFPKEVRLGKKSVRWRVSDILEYIAVL